LFESKYQVLRENIIESIKESLLANPSSLPSNNPNAEELSKQQILELIAQQLEIFAADRIEKADYALESAGAAIVPDLTSSSYKTSDSIFSIFFASGYGKPPGAILQPDTSVGNCWAFSGSKGKVGIKLAQEVIPESFSLEHISPQIAYHFSSAPKNFLVWGLQSESENVLLGNFTYMKPDGKLYHQIQTFPLVKTLQTSFEIVQLEILSNYDHPDYTCIYRFRVHGKPIFQ